MYDVTFMCMVMKDDNKPVIALKYVIWLKFLNVVHLCMLIYESDSITVQIF